MHQPLFELIRQVRTYSRPWTHKYEAIAEVFYFSNFASIYFNSLKTIIKGSSTLKKILNPMYENIYILRQQHVLDVAIRKLEHYHATINKMKQEKRMSLWTRLVKKLVVQILFS